jgi:hypothetical protein
MHLDSSAIIPIINMAVVLTDMGLSRPAARYLALAEAIDPGHPWLRRNFISGLHRVKPGEVADTDTVYEPRVLDVDKVPKKNSGMSLWDDEALRVWGITGSEVYEH